MTKLLGPQSYRALLFVRTLNEQGLQPSHEEVDAFIEAKVALFDYDPHSEGLFARTVDYLLDARLLRLIDDGVALTPAGDAVLRAEMIDPSSMGRGRPLIVGRMSDPHVYAQLLNEIDDVSEPLIVDPYLHPSDLATLGQLRGAAHILTRNVQIIGLKKPDRAQKLRIALGGSRTGTELRYAPDDSRELHDRLIIPRSGGEAIFLGTSLGGTQLTVVTRIGGDATAALRAHYGAIWRAAAPVDPIAR